MTKLFEELAPETLWKKLVAWGRQSRQTRDLSIVLRDLMNDWAIVALGK